MITLWLCVAAVLAASPAHGEDIVHTLRLHPALNSTLAGVFQVTLMNDQQQPEYAYNAIEARELCERLGVTIASKAQVQEALDRGLETCRFGWVDEQIAVVPRINSRKTCGQGGLGLVTWRTDIIKKFDVFCFNSSAEDAQPRNVTIDKTVSASEVMTSTDIMTLPQAELFVGSEESSSGGKAVLITSACGLLLVAVIVVVYMKLRRRRSDPKQQTADVEAE